MANSSIIEDLKNTVITELVNDPDMFAAIDSPDIQSFDDSDKLVNTHLFRFAMNPTVINKDITFLTFQVHIQDPYLYKTYVKPRLEIWVYSHHSHMFVDNVPKIIANRNDYIAMMLDSRFNGRDTIGYLTMLGKLDLVLNTEGSYNPEWMFRHLIFETKEINNNFCA